MAETADNIHAFFRQYGWEYDFDEATQSWMTGFRGDTGDFDVLVHLTDAWLYFIISPLVQGPSDAACQLQVYRYILRLNYEMNLAKLSVDPEGDIVLSVELPTENLTYSDFCDGLNALSYYADECFLDLLQMTADPNYQPHGSADEPWGAEPRLDSEIGINKPN